MTILNIPIEWKDFATTTDFKGMASISLFAKRDGAKLDSIMVPVAKHGNELVFIGDSIDFVAVYRPDRVDDFPNRALKSALWHAATYRPSFASRHMRRDGSLKKGIKWEIKLVKYAD